MGFCANCGTPRNGNVRFCGSCGTEFDDSPAAPGEQATQASGWTAPAEATRTDMSPRDTLIDPPGAKAGQPDPFASWYSSAQPAAAPEPPRGRPDTYWQQPTETVRPAAQGPGGYPAPPPAGYGAPPAPGGYPTAPAPVYGAPYPPGPAGGPPQRGGGGRRALLVVLAVIVVLAAGGGAYALATRLGKHSTAGPSSPPASTPAASSPSGATQPATGTGSPPASASASASSSGSSSSPAANLVAVGSGVSGAAVPAVQQLLNKRFEGINTHNYAEYASTLTTREQANQPQSKFDSGYRSTTDSAITLTALSQTSSGLTATVAFTSHQNPSDSGDGSACNTWTTNYYLVASGTGYLIDVTPAGSPPPSRGDC